METEKPLPGADAQPTPGLSLTQRVMTMSGYAMLLSSAGLLIFLAYQYLQAPFVDAPKGGQDVWVWALQFYGDDVFILLAAIFLAFVGLRLLLGAGKGAPRVIPVEDRQLLEPLIAAANKDAIAQYVVLSSLSGFTGTFQKIGFSGLPLATSILTLIFSMLSFLNLEFLELAKLTLGAFIGSFVQKGVDAPKLPIITSTGG